MEYKKIHEFAQVLTGGTPSTDVKEYWEGGTIPWLQSGCCQNCYVSKASKYITKKGYDNSVTKLMPENTILIALTGATAGKVGYLTFEACGNQSITGILPNEVIAPKFLYYYLQNKRGKILSDCVGGAQPHISQAYVKNIDVPIYSKSEQIKIVGILDNIVYQLETFKFEMQKLEELVKSQFIEMFGDPIENSKGLPTNDLEKVLLLKAGDFTKASDIVVEPTNQNIYPCYGGNGIRGYVAEYNQQGAYSLIGRQGALSGNVQYVTGKFKNTEHALLVTPLIEMNSIWLHHLLINLDLKRYQTGAAQPGLSVKNLQEIPIIEVPTEEQNQFADFVQQIDKSKFLVQNQIKLLEELLEKKMNEFFEQ